MPVTDEYNNNGVLSLPTHCRSSKKTRVILLLMLSNITIAQQTSFMTCQAIFGAIKHIKRSYKKGRKFNENYL